MKCSLYSSPEEAEKLQLDHCHVVLVDLPPSKEILVRLFSGKKVSRIYAHFYKAESDFFSTIPTRDHFKWYYALLAKKGPFDLKKYGDTLAKHRGWTRETVDFMSQVFFELDFVTMDNGLITLNKNAEKHDLTESKTYQLKHAQLELEKDLLFSSFHQLKDWFDQVIQETVQYRGGNRRMDLKKYITIVEDWPKPGISFKDITTLMDNGEAYRYATDQIVQYAREKEIDLVVGPEARGFIIGCPVAYSLGVGFAPVRKEGKLPRETIKVDYGLEYGKDVLTIHKDAIKPGQRVLITDDLLATGGTIEATIQLVEELGGIVAGIAFLIELSDLDGRSKLESHDILTLMTF